MFVVTTAIKKLLKLKKRKKIVQGGTSAGKTFGILPILIDRAIRGALPLGFLAGWLTAPHISLFHLSPDAPLIPRLYVRLLSWKSCTLAVHANRFANGAFVRAVLQRLPKLRSLRQ